MALQIRRGTEAERTAGGGVVFAEGEIVYIIDTYSLYIGDGVTAGGVLLTSNDFAAINDMLVANTINDRLELQKNLDLNSNDITGIGNINIDGTITATGNINIGDNAGEDVVTIGATVDSSITPTSDSTYDLGSTDNRWANIFVDDATVTNAITATSVNANILGDDLSTIIDVSTRDATVNSVTLANGAVISEASNDVVIDASNEPSNVIVLRVNGGDVFVDNAGVLNAEQGVVGKVTGDLTGSVFADDSALLVDGVNGIVVADVTGDVFGYIRAENGTSILNPGTDGTNASFIGSVQGNVTGNVTGNLNGNVTGNVTGNVIGNVTGDLTGSVFADDSTLLVDGVNGIVPGSAISGTITADLIGNVTGDVIGNVTGTLTGNVLTSSIDSADSSAITVTPATIFSSDVTVENNLYNSNTIYANFINASLGGASPVYFNSGAEFVQPVVAQNTLSVLGQLSSLDSILVGENVGGSIELRTQLTSTKAEFLVPVKFPVVADDSARSTLVPTPEKGMVILMESGTTPAATNQLQFFDGSNWVNV